ncbi:MAG: alanine racemase [Bacillus subtilis]|nr:alanine racemase [Bacillus subtilis]
MRYHRDTTVGINLDHLIDNVKNLKEHYCPTQQIMAVVKADAYGHGAIPLRKPFNLIKSTLLPSPPSKKPWSFAETGSTALF